jgi:hypothetical protein
VLITMNKCELKVFTAEEEGHIMSECFNSCTVVAIVSPLACVLAHILPQPPIAPNDPRMTAGDRNARDKMDEVARWYANFVYDDCNAGGELA